VIYAHHGIYLFYLVGVHMLSGNPEHVVIDIHHAIDQFYLLGVYILSINP